MQSALKSLQLAFKDSVWNETLTMPGRILLLRSIPGEINDLKSQTEALSYPDGGHSACVHVMHTSSLAASDSQTKQCSEQLLRASKSPPHLRGSR